MYSSSTASLSGLIVLCRALRHNLSAGVNIVKVFGQQAERGPRELREFAGRVHGRLLKGDDLAAAMANERSVPPLMRALVAVGEETGHLPEVLAALEQYYTLQLRLRRQFLARVTTPLVQLVLAVLIIALVIFILGVVGAPFRILGLSGPIGAVTFLAAVFGTLGIVYLAFRVLLPALRGRRLADAILLRLPVVGPCAEAIALGRFTLALQMTLDTALPVHRAVRLALAATGNAVYEGASPGIERELKSGETLTRAFAGAKIFPAAFIQALAVAEESGRVPEVMRKLCRDYNEEASRQLTALSQLAAWGVWTVYAVFMIVMILQFAQVYLRYLGSAVR